MEARSRIKNRLYRNFNGYFQLGRDTVEHRRIRKNRGPVKSSPGQPMRLTNVMASPRLNRARSNQESGPRRFPRSWKSSPRSPSLSRHPPPPKSTNYSDWRGIKEIIPRRSFIRHCVPDAATEGNNRSTGKLRTDKSLLVDRRSRRKVQWYFDPEVRVR